MVLTSSFAAVGYSPKPGAGPTISFLQMAQILRERLGPLAERVPKRHQDRTRPD
jgi:hypothetical protein